MIVRTKIVTGTPDLIEPGAQLYRDAVVPSCSGVEGFLGGWFLAERSTGRMMTLTLWAHERGLVDALEALHTAITGDPGLLERCDTINAGGARWESWTILESTGPTDLDGALAERGNARTLG